MVYVEGRSISANFYLANLTSYSWTLSLISTFLLQLNSRRGKYYNDPSDYQSVVIETVQFGRRFNVFIAFFYVVELLYTLKPSEIFHVILIIALDNQNRM
jgi:hypothetical protein